MNKDIIMAKRNYLYVRNGTKQNVSEVCGQIT